MLPWVHLATGAVPGESGALRLMQRGDEFSIVVDTIELMNSRRSGSERALATLACAHLGGRARPRMLIGGLGLGFTLRAALEGLGPDAEITVAEIVPALAEWARGPLAHIFAGCLDDPRVTLVPGDVNRVIQAGPARYDAILLDVDNGPEGLLRQANDRLYDEWGLKRARWALRPDGLLAVWSGAPSRKFKARLQRVGFAVEEHRVASSGGGSGPRHVVWIGTMAADGPARASGPHARPAATPPRRR